MGCLLRSINYSKENKKEYHKNLHTDKINKSMENSLPKYITLTEDNIDKEYICCAFSDKKNAWKDMSPKKGNG